MKKLFLAITLISVTSIPAIAEMKHEHSGHSMQATKKEDQSHKMDTLETKIGGYEVSLDIMTHKDYQNMMKAMKMTYMNPTSGTSHHIAAIVRKDGSKIENALLNIKVTGPDGKEESKTMPYNQDMMFQYTGHYSMAKKGNYQVLITFEIGQEKHQGTVNYEVK